MPETNIRVTVILLNWNGWPDVVNCVRSLQAMNNHGYTIIIVDNNSDDDSVMQLRQRMPEIEIIENRENLGFSAGCNVGIRRAVEKGTDYIWLLNPDTLVYEDTLDALLAKAGSSHDTGITGAAIYQMDDHDSLQTWGGGILNINTGMVRFVKRHGRIDYISGACMLIPTRVFEDVGLLDDRYFMYWEDADFSIRVRRAGYALLVAEDARLLHKATPRCKNLPKKTEYMSISSVRFIRKHAKIPALTIAICVIRRVFSVLVRGRLDLVRVIILATAREVAG